MSGRTRLPGAVGISHVSAYDWPAVDGVCGGSPHLHLTCTEAYVVTGGRGSLQTLTVADGYVETDLEPGIVTWFTAGTVHRMVEREGLRVAIVMQNSGLPEAGDAVFTFPPHVLADREAYTAAAALPGGEGPDVAAAARRRRDLAVEGYLELQAASLAGDTEPLLEFHRAASRLVEPRLAQWRARWREGALADARQTGEQLDALVAGDASHLAQARSEATPPTRIGGFGMCGRRDEYAC